MWLVLVIILLVFFNLVTAVCLRNHVRGYQNLKKRNQEESDFPLFFMNWKNKRYIQEIEEYLKEYVFPDYQSSDAKRLELLNGLYGTEPSEAIYLLTYLQKASALEGDVCEFGIERGATSALIANEILPLSKNLWLYDSFQGLPKPSIKDQLKDDIFNLGSMEAYQGWMSAPIEEVKGRLARVEFPAERTKIVPGFIEETIKHGDLLPEKICFAYVDFDFYEPILIALNYLHRAIVKNGYIMVDDYDYFSTGAKTAVDEFYKQHATDYELIFPVRPAGHFCLLQRK